MSLCEDWPRCFLRLAPVGHKAARVDMRWLCYGQVKGVTGGVTIIRELLGVKGVTGDLNIIILTLVLSHIILEVCGTLR